MPTPRSGRSIGPRRGELVESLVARRAPMSKAPMARPSRRRMGKPMKLRAGRCGAALVVRGAVEQVALTNLAPSLEPCAKGCRRPRQTRSATSQARADRHRPSYAQAPGAFGPSACSGQGRTAARSAAAVSRAQCARAQPIALWQAPRRQTTGAVSASTTWQASVSRPPWGEQLQDGCPGPTGWAARRVRIPGAGVRSVVRHGRSLQLLTIGDAASDASISRR